MALLFQIGRATRTGTVEWTSPDPIAVPEGEELCLTGNINPPQLTDPARQIRWELWRSPDGAAYSFLAAGTWIGGEGSGQPEICLPARIVNGFFIRGRAVITGTVNFGLTIETR